MVPDRIVLKDIQARDKLIKGADYLADCVKLTIGPGGQNFLLEKGLRVTNDGVTIAQEIRLKDEVEDLGARKMKEIASRTNDEAGDGTTTAVTLGQAVLKAGIMKLKQEGEFKGKLSPMQLVKKIEEEKLEIIEKLKGQATPVESEDALVEVATVSVEDPTLGELIGKAQWLLGKNGYILAEETALPESSVENIKGIRIDNGFSTSLLMNNHEKGCLELADVPLILTNHVVKDLNPLTVAIEGLIKQGAKQLVIVASAFTEEVVQQCMTNIKKGNFQIYPINAPYVDQAQVMYDMAAVLGGRFINKEEDHLASIQLSDVAYAKRVIGRRWDAIFTGDESEKASDRVEKRIEVLEKKKVGEGSDFMKNALDQRIAQLKNGFALLKIGSTSETDRKYKKDKADDAVNAVRAALQEGTVKGGGLALKEIADELPEDYILKRAIVAPYEQIQSNAGGFEVEGWVRDPVKVIRVALEKACSVASVFATAAGVIVTEKLKPHCGQPQQESSQEVN